MKKVKTTVFVVTIHGSTFEFRDIDGEKNGTSAARSIQNKEQIDAVGLMEGEAEEARYIIPFHAISEAAITMTSEDAEIPSDDNCKGEKEIGSFVIRNTGDEGYLIMPTVSGNHIGTFGDITFVEYVPEYDQSEPSGPVTIPSGGSVTISGLPVGTSVFDGSDLLGTVPGSAEVGGESPK